MNLKKDDSLLKIGLSDGNQGIVLTTKAGYATLYSEQEISVLGLKAGGIKGINLKNDELVSMSIFNPLKSDSYFLVSDQPGIKRLRISDIPSCNRATKGNLVFKTPKTNLIHAFDAFVLQTQDSLTLKTDNQSLDVTVKDYSYGQLLNKPSQITTLKDEKFLYVYNPLTLSTDLYQVENIQNQNITTEIFEIKEEPDLFEETQEEMVEEEKVEPVIVKPVQPKKVQKEEPKEDDKHFEPISFDDLFKDDF